MGQQLEDLMKFLVLELLLTKRLNQIFKKFDYQGRVVDMNIDISKTEYTV